MEEQSELPTSPVTSPVVAGAGQLSEALKEKLRKSGRCYFKSPMLQRQMQDSSMRSGTSAVSSSPACLSVPIACHTPLTTPPASSPGSCGRQKSSLRAVGNSDSTPLRGRLSSRFHPFRSPLLRDVSNTVDVGSTRGGCRRVFGEKGDRCEADDHREDDGTLTALVEEKKKLSLAIDKEKERLRKLNLVQVYRKKNDLVALETLTQKWRSAAQRLLVDLRDLILENASADEAKPSLKQMMDQYMIDPNLLGYEPEENGFSVEGGNRSVVFNFPQ